MRKVLSRIAWVAIGAVFLMASIGIGVVILGNTDSGRAGILTFVARLTAGQVKLAGLSGSFPSHLRLVTLELRDSEGVWLSARDIVLDWTPLASLSGRLQIDGLKVAGIDMQRLPRGTTGSSADPVIPRIDVARATIGVLRLGAALTGTQASLSVNGVVHLRSVRDMQIDATALRTDGDGVYALHLSFDRARMDGSLHVHEPANGPLENILSLPGLGALDARLSLAGPRSAEKITAALEAGALRGNAQGVLDMRDYSSDLSFDFESAGMRPRADLAWAHAALHGRWQGDLRTPHAQATLDIDELRAPGVPQLGKLEGEFAAQAGKATLHARIAGWQIPGPSPSLLADAPVLLDATAQLDDPGRPVVLAASHRLFSLRARLITAGMPSADLELRLSDLTALAALAAPAAALRGSALIKAHADGTLADNHLALDAQATLAPGGQTFSTLLGEHPSLKLQGSLGAAAVSIDSAKFSGGALQMEASGTARPGTAAAPQAAQTLHFKWSAQIADLTALSPALRGMLHASGQLDGPIDQLAAAAQVNSSVSVRGSPRGDITAEIKFRGTPKAQSGRLAATGSLDGAPLQVDVAMERNSSGLLQVMVHRADWKSVHADGEASSTAAGADARGQIRLRIGELADFTHLAGADLAGSVTGSLSLQPDRRATRAQLQLDGLNVAVAGIAGNVKLSGAGAADDFPFKLDVQLPELRGAAAALDLGGTLDLDARTVTVAHAVATYRGQDIALLAPARIAWGSGFVVDGLELGAQQALLQVQGQILPALSLSATLTHVQPGLVNVFVPALLSAGTLEAHAELHGRIETLTGVVSVNATGVRFADDAALGVPALDLHADAELKGTTADIEAKLGGGNSQLRVSGRAPIALEGGIDLKINGGLDAGLLNPVLEARGQHATGRLDIDATVGGSVDEPRLGGTVTLAQGGFRDYSHGISLTDIKGEMVGSEGTLKIKSLTAAAAPGSLSMSGSIGILQPHWPVDLHITAQNAEPSTSKLVTANLNADLRVTGSARQRLDVAGTVHLNRALIGIPNGLPPNVAVLNVRRRGKTARAVPDKPLIIGLDVAVEAPQEILVQGRGLDAELRGGLYISGTLDTPLVSGHLDLQRGSFTLGSSKLNLTPPGQISFNSAGLKNKIDPSLDFTAETTIAGGATAKLAITGFADAPVFAFSSSDDRPPDEIMALLLFGVPAAQLSALQLAQIGAALASLSGVGGDSALNPLVKLQKSLRLDRLTVGSGATNATGESSGASIQAGRYISRRIYIEAKQNTQGTSQLEADVDLTKRLKLQTRLGNGTASVQGSTPENDPGSSVGLIYQFEY
jgi:translocation and assembly module TamB